MNNAFALHRGNCAEVMRTLDPASVDAIVTDPPYELGFMGKSWDSSGIAYDVTMWREAYRVLKPGAHLLAFSGSRTYHRMVVAIEDAGFEIRDQLMWLYGSGFPKSRNLDGDWNGWGTALKPAHEPIVLARKPLAKGCTVAANVRAHGTGALNIDACRVESEDQPSPFGNPSQAEGWRLNQRETDWQPSEIGRWPANLIHDGSNEVLDAFPDAPGQLADASTNAGARKTQNTYGTLRRGSPRPDDGPRAFQMKPGTRRDDAGSAARFFYCAKASREDRNEGCGHLTQKVGGMVSNTSEQHLTRRDTSYEPKPLGNFHPTVKPTALMAYLVRLVTPPNGTVLDPFMGSGSTGKAAVLEGLRFIGIERDQDADGNPLGYMEIARARIEFAARMGHQPSLLEVEA